MIVFFREFYEHPPFYQWLKKNAVITLLFVMLGYIDMVSLELLYSNIGVFQTPFTLSSKQWVYLGTLISVTIEDVPQLVMLVSFTTANNINTAKLY